MEKTFKVKISKDSYLNFNFNHTEIDKLSMRDYDIEKLTGQLLGVVGGGRLNFTENEKVLQHVFRKRFVIESLRCDDNCVNCENCNDSNEIMFNEQIQLELPWIDEEVEIKNEFLRILEFAKKVRNGEIRSFTDEKFENIVNIGIGGSDLGNRLLEKSFSYKKSLNVEFISNIDPTAVLNVLNRVDVKKTLFIVISKTWSTKETLKNAQIIKDYLKEVFPNKDVSKNFVTVSSKPEIAEENFGSIHNFKIWTFFGGRFSIWSGVGITIALSYGFCVFKEFLAGACVYDEQGYKALKADRISETVVFIHAVLELYYMKKGYTKCLVPYSDYLKYFYKYVQQLEMESNGKIRSGMVVWGGTGTDTQHSFFQMIHQGDKNILTEFIMPISPIENPYLPNTEKDSKVIRDTIKDNHRILVSNCLAQAKALWFGKKDSDVNKNFTGKKPNFIVSFKKLTPRVLGALVAHNEIKAIIQGFLLKINSFDQFGVNLGKVLANDIEKELINVSGGEVSSDNRTIEEEIRIYKEVNN